MAKTTSEQGIAFIKKREGCVLKAYWDVNGYAIGYGHHGGINKGDTCTQAQADTYLKEDLKKYENAVNSLGYNFNQNQFDALIDFTYNCGTGNLRQLTQSGKRTIEQIGNSITKYSLIKGIFSKGTYSRRLAEKQRYFTPIATDPNEYYPIYTGDSGRIDIVFEEIGATVDYDYIAASSWERRKPIAIANGIKTYKGTAKQNIKLISLAKTGKLKRV